MRRFIKGRGHVGPLRCLGIDVSQSLIVCNEWHTCQLILVSIERCFEERGGKRGSQCLLLHRIVRVLHVWLPALVLSAVNLVEFGVSSGRVDLLEIHLGWSAVWTGLAHALSVESLEACGGSSSIIDTHGLDETLVLKAKTTLRLESSLIVWIPSLDIARTSQLFDKVPANSLLVLRCDGVCIDNLWVLC